MASRRDVVATADTGACGHMRSCQRMGKGAATMSARRGEWQFMAANGMDNKTQTLTLAQQRAISALLSAKNTVDAARMANVKLRTLGRWLADDVFRAELQTAQATVLSTAVRRMTNASNTALDVLCDVMTNGATESLKLRSALGLLAALPAMRQMVDFETRLAALEAAQGARHE